MIHLIGWASFANGATTGPAAETGQPAHIAGKVAAAGKRLRKSFGPGAWYTAAFVVVYLTLTLTANLL